MLVFADRVKRFQAVADSSAPGKRLREDSDSDNLRGFKAFSVSQVAGFFTKDSDGASVGGAGIGDATKAFDPLYDSAHNAWLLATVNYDVVGPGTTDLYLQVGELGIRNSGETTGQNQIVFGDVTDPVLYGGRPPSATIDDSFFREQDSLTPDATITVYARGPAAAGVPEPTSWVLSMLAVSWAFFAVGGRRWGGGEKV